MFTYYEKAGINVRKSKAHNFFRLVIFFRDGNLEAPPFKSVILLIKR